MSTTEEDLNREEIFTELSECRSDERDSTNRFLQVIATSGTILALVFGASSFSSINKSILFHLSNLVFCTAVGYCYSVGIESGIRFHYIRHLEDCLAKLHMLPMADDSNAMVHWMSFTSPITTHNVRHVRNKYGILHYITFTASLSSIIIFCLLVIAVLYRNIGIKSWYDKTAFYLAISFLLFTVVSYFYCTSNAVEMYSIAKKVATENRKKRLLSGELSQNGHLSFRASTKNIFYYILPRREALVKAFLMVCGFLYGALIQGKNITQELIINEMLPSLVIIEFLLYQSRYQWNDIRGLPEDVLAHKTGRLPKTIFGYRKSVNLSVIVIIIKVILAFIIIAQMKGYRSTYAGIIIILFVLAVTYEYARKRHKSYLIFSLVCLGYPIRFFSGFAISSHNIRTAITNCVSPIKSGLLGLWSKIKPLPISFSKPPLVLLCVLFFAIAFLGGFCVILSWTREAVKQHKTSSGKGVIKPHYRTLLKRVFSLDNGDHPLTYKSNGLLFQPWNYTFLITSILLSIASYFATMNLLMALVLEGIILILSLVITGIGHPTSQKLLLRLWPFYLLALTFVAKILFTCMLFKSVDFSSLFIIAFQILSTLLYSYLRFVYIDGCSIIEILQKLWYRICYLIIGDTTACFLKKQKSPKN